MFNVVCKRCGQASELEEVFRGVLRLSGEYYVGEFECPHCEQNQELE